MRAKAGRNEAPTAATRSCTMETAPAASLPTRTCARNLTAAPGGDGGAPRVGGGARQPSVGSTD
eukprot:11838603-Alexandrium_andersonii.AAC.1